MASLRRQLTTRTGGNALHLHSGRFFMQTIRIIPSIPVPTILIPELWLKKTRPKLTHSIGNEQRFSSVHSAVSPRL